jgi:hypothetical protein
MRVATADNRLTTRAQLLAVDTSKDSPLSVNEHSKLVTPVGVPKLPEHVQATEHPWFHDDHFLRRRGEVPLYPP